jgi:hypothetical protein
VSEDDPFADSFSFLKPQENATIGEQVLWEVFGSKQKPKPVSNTETGEKARKLMETEAIKIAQEPQTSQVVQ